MVGHAMVRHALIRPRPDRPFKPSATSLQTGERSLLRSLTPPSMGLLKNNQRSCRVSAIPQGCEVAIFAGKLVENDSRLPRQVGLHFTLPEHETLFQRNPVGCHADIDNDELNRRGSEQVADVTFGECSASCGCLESILSPQLSKW